MEYTSKLLVNFLKKLVVFDKDTRSAIEAVSRVFNNRTSEEKNEWRQVQSSAEQQSKSYSLKVQSITSDFQKQMNSCRLPAKTATCAIFGGHPVT